MEYFFLILAENDFIVSYENGVIDAYTIKPSFENKGSFSIDMTVLQSYYSNGFVALMAKDPTQNNTNNITNSKYKSFLDNNSNNNNTNSNKNYLYIKQENFLGKMSDFPLTKINAFTVINQILIFFGNEGIAYLKQEVVENTLNLTLLHLQTTEGIINTLAEYSGNLFTGNSLGIFGCWNFGNNGLELTGSMQIGNVRSLFKSSVLTQLLFIKIFS